jgi:hypothetical protein
MGATIRVCPATAGGRSAAVVREAPIEQVRALMLVILSGFADT